MPRYTGWGKDIPTRLLLWDSWTVGHQQGDDRSKVWFIWAELVDPWNRQTGVFHRYSVKGSKYSWGGNRSIRLKISPVCRGDYRGKVVDD